jgi:iron complex outermembrane receptor protein
MKNATFGCLLSTALLGAAGVVTRPASADQAAERDSAPMPMLEEIVVTAQKRSETLQEVPLAVSAVTGQQLDNLGATDFSDYYRQVPGLEAIDRGDGQKKYILRGLNSESAPSLAPIVQQYLDEFPLTLVSGAQSDLRLYDLERVEVLRGPQGTLYGSGSMGGTIKNVTARPDLENIGGQVEVTASDTDHGSVNSKGHAVLNLPIVPGELGIRALAYDEYDSGYIDNVITGEKGTNDTHVSGGRISIRWKPAAPLDLNLMVLDQRLRSGDLSVDTSGFVAPAAPFPPQVPWFPGGARSGDLQVVKSASEPTADDTFITNLTGSYDFDWAQLTSSTTYYRRTTNLQQDTPELLGYGSYDVTNTRATTSSEELRLSNQSGRLKWLGGLYYLHNRESPEETRQTAFLPGGSVYFIEGIEDRSEQEALFGEISYDLLSQLTATVGVRRARYDETQSTVLEPSAWLGPFGVNQHTTTEKYELSSHPSRETLLYVLASSGFRPGGFNSTAFNPLINASGNIARTYGSDSLWNYEIGWKQSLLDQRLTFDTAAYYIDWSDIQVTEFDPSGLYSYEGNASRAHVYGLEAEWRFVPFSGLQLSLNGAYNDAELAENEPGAYGPVPPHTDLPGLAGDRLPDVPLFSGAMVASYEAPLAQSGLRGFVNTSLTYTGKSATAFRSEDSLYRILPAYALLNLRLGVEQSGWRATMFADNLTDRRAVLFIDPRAGYNRDYVNRPRTVGVTFTKEF